MNTFAISLAPINKKKTYAMKKKNKNHGEL